MVKFHLFALTNQLLCRWTQRADKPINHPRCSLDFRYGRKDTTRNHVCPCNSTLCNKLMPSWDRVSSLRSTSRKIIGGENLLAKVIAGFQCFGCVAILEFENISMGLLLSASCMLGVWLIVSPVFRMAYGHRLAVIESLHRAFACASIARARSWSSRILLSAIPFWWCAFTAAMVIP
jgi:hypothetical protein